MRVIMSSKAATFGSISEINRELKNILDTAKQTKVSFSIFQGRKYTVSTGESSQKLSKDEFSKYCSEKVRALYELSNKARKYMQPQSSRNSSETGLDSKSFETRIAIVQNTERAIEALRNLKQSDKSTIGLFRRIIVKICEAVISIFSSSIQNMHQNIGKYDSEYQRYGNRLNGFITESRSSINTDIQREYKASKSLLKDQALRSFHSQLFESQLEVKGISIFAEKANSDTEKYDIAKIKQLKEEANLEKGSKFSSVVDGFIKAYDTKNPRIPFQKIGFLKNDTISEKEAKKAVLKLSVVIHPDKFRDSSQSKQELANHLFILLNKNFSPFIKSQSLKTVEDHSSFPQKCGGSI